MVNPNVPANPIQSWIAEHPASTEQLKARANIEAARSAWPSVNVSVTVVGWKRPDGKLWDVTNNVTVFSPMLLPNESGSMPLSFKSVTYSQDSENGTTTTLDLTLPGLLTLTPFPGVVTDQNGNFVDNPVPNQAQPDPPDTSSAQP